MKSLVENRILTKVGQDEPTLSKALRDARPRSVAEVLRLYKPFYEKLLKLNVSIRDSTEKRDAPAQCHRWLVELDCGCVTERRQVPQQRR
jgi:hypothetical protein